MVFKTHAGDLDLLIENQRVARRLRSRVPQINCRHILPATSVNESKANRQDACESHVWTHAPQGDARAPQKEDQCQES
jgi:hypothetical protein